MGNAKYVTYADFGAVGDGVTNDFFAIKAAHDFANEKGLPVKADGTKTYLITETEVDGVAETISIKTDTDWCGAHIIIDDTDVAWCEGQNKKYSANIFTVESYYPSVRVDEEHIRKINEAGGIDKDTVKKIDTGLGYPAMLIVYNENTRHFIRYGGNQNSGAPQKELAVVDKDGNIDPTTPFLFDFDNVSYIVAYRIDVPTLTLENATITSRASQVNLVDQYHSINRGIAVTRPNTYIRNIDHKITGEYFKGELVDGVPFVGHSYNGILGIRSTHNVLVENFTFQARAYYLQGTYDMGASLSNMLVFKNCNQSNFFPHHDPDYPLMPAFGKWWGVAGTNFCKNMIYDGCNLTRYDAHCGVVNGKILNSTIASIRLTGGGDMLIENTKIYYWNPGTPIQLREDYGCTWDGTITIKDCEFADVTGKGILNNIIMHRSSNWNFGYQTTFPNIVIDNLKFENHKPEMSLLFEFEQKANQYGFFYRSVMDKNLAVAGALCSDGRPNENPQTPPKFIKVINNEKNGYEITLPDVPFFKDTELVGIKLKKSED